MIRTIIFQMLPCILFGAGLLFWPATVTVCADEVGLFLWALDTDAAAGVYNATAPNPVTNREFSQALGRALSRPAVMPVPKLAIRLRFGSELADVVTGSQRALPRRAQDEGYVFRAPEIDAAMREALA